MTEILFPSGKPQSGNMSIEKEPKKVLKSSLEILNKAYRVAKKKDDLENMLAISDRLMLLYELLKNNETKKTAMGFLREMDDE